MKRRVFLKHSLTAAAAIAMPNSRILGANNDIRVAMVGLGSFVKIGGKGRGDLETFRKMPGVRVVALCDVDSANLAPIIEKCNQRNEKVAVYKDVRKLLEDKNIDVIVNSTPNHWHALITIWACQAEKDVFVQKPASHNIWEGRKMVEAARKYNRIVQSGSGPRSRTGMREAYQYIRKGNLGKILYAHGINYKPRASIGKVSGPQPIPSTLDYDLWCGPAPKVKLMRKYLHYDWHWDWATGDGDLGNMGIHYMDACRLALDLNHLPERVLSIGGRFAYEDDGQTPNTQIAFLDYQPAPIIFEVRGLPRNKTFLNKWGANEMDTYMGVRIGTIIHCEGGYVAGNIAHDKNGKEIKKFEPTNLELRANFIKAVRTRKTTDLNSDILEGHLSATLVHMANISHRLGKQKAPQEIAEAIKTNKNFSEAYNRFKTHLEANEVDLEKTPPTLGQHLQFNPKKELFTGPSAKKANKLAKPKYRKPYTIPKKL